MTKIIKKSNLNRCQESPFIKCGSCGKNKKDNCCEYRIEDHPLRNLIKLEGNITYLDNEEDGTTTIIVGDYPEDIDVQIRVRGDKIQWGNPEEGWNDLIDLEELKGPKGDKGLKLEIRVEDGYIQTKHEDETSWTNLININELIGPRGKDGSSVRLRLSADYIQWSRTDSNEWHNLVSLENITGPEGPEGEKGEEGKSAYEIWLAQGNDGDETDFILSLIGDKGDKGDRGKDGYSAYDIWLDEPGNTGEVSDFLESLVGEDGEDGEDGLSAFEIWLNEGNEGSIDIFLESIKGEKGEKGEQGDIGPRGNIGEKGVPGEDGKTCFSYVITSRSEETEITYTPCDQCDESENTEIFKSGVRMINSSVVPKLEKGIADIDCHGIAKGEKGDDGEKGEKGEDGLSAFEVWLENNPEGTYEEYIEHIKGEKGEDGLSAFEIWLEENPDGSMGEYLESMQAEDGAPGVTCRKYEITLTEESTIRYTPCDNCDEEEVEEIFLTPIQCGQESEYSATESGYPVTQAINLGSGTGEVELEVRGSSVPDRFIVFQDSNIIYDSGYRGDIVYSYGGTERHRLRSALNGKKDPLTGNTYPLPTSTPGILSDGYPEIKDDGTVYFDKTDTESQYEMKVYAPIEGTGWGFTMGCPDNGEAEDPVMTLYSSTEPVIVTGEGVVSCKSLASGKTGKTGPEGKSAFQIWRAKEGNAGSTEDDFFKWLKGEDGKSAYDIWLEEGNVGSKSDFLDWLRENSGDKYYEEEITDDVTDASIFHDLDKYPAVHVQDTAGVRIETMVTYIDKKQIRVSSDKKLINTLVVCN